MQHHPWPARLIAGLAFVSFPLTSGAAELSAEKSAAVEQAFRDAAIAQAIQVASAQLQGGTAQALGPSGPATFRTYTIEKPLEQQAEEVAQEELTKRAFRTEPEPNDEIPSAAAPDVRLHGAVGYSYRTTHDAPLARTFNYSLRGTAYDWDVDGQSNYKDITTDSNTAFRHDYSFLDLRRPNWRLGFFDQSLSLYPLRGQTENLYGTKIEHLWAPSQATMLAAGRTEASVASTGTASATTKYLGHVYGGQHTFTPTSWFKLRGGAFYFDNEADLPERVGTSDFPRSNWLPEGGAEVTLFKDLTLSGYAAVANYQPDNDPDTTVHDIDWRTGWEWNRERMHSRMAYEFVGDAYASTGDPASYRDYQGWDWSGSYDFTDAWTLSGTATRYHNNVNEDASRTTSHSQALSVSSRHRLPWDQSLTLSFSDFLSDPDGGVDAGSSLRTDLYRLDYFLPFLFDSRLLTSYEYGRNDSRTSSDSTTHRVNGSLFKSFGQGGSVALSQQMSKTEVESQPNNLTLTTSVSVDQRLSSWLTGYANTSYNYTQTTGESPDHVISASTGARFRFDENRSATLEYAINSYALPAERDRWPRSWSIFGFFTQGFEISSAPAFGAIEGYVFDDANGNGAFDPGESLISDATVSLPNARHTSTDASGHFTFFRVVPGAQAVHLDSGTLDPQWAVSEPTQKLTVKKHHTAIALFPLTKTGLLRGRVFLDANHNFVFDNNEEPVEGVVVGMEPGEQFRKTDEEGAFTFDHVLPGQYSVRLHGEGMPTGYVPEMGERADVVIAPGETVEATDFPLKLQEAEIKKF